MWIAIILILLIFISKVIGGLIIGGFFKPPINEIKMERIFNDDKDYLSIITEYFENIYYADIYITNTMDSSEFSVGGKHIKIDNKTVVESINYLKKHGYSVITKDNNTICFQRWCNLDNGRGIAYSINGEEPKLQFLTKLKPFSEKDWYYYEEDFNKWKDENK